MQGNSYVRTVGKIFPHVCDVLWWSFACVYLAKDTMTGVKLIFAVTYLCLCNAVLNLDRFYLQMIFVDRMTFELDEVINSTLTIIANTPLIIFVYKWKELCFLLFYNFASFPCYRKLYSFFLDFFIALDSVAFGSKFLRCAYITCKLLHIVFILVNFLVIIPYIWKCQYISYLHPNDGIVHYNASNLDGNGVRKCDEVEYIHGIQYAAQKLRTSRSNICSAIRGEYVTLSCNITIDDPIYSNNVFQWKRGDEAIQQNTKYKITYTTRRNSLSGDVIWISNLTIVEINDIDFNTFHCLAISDIECSHLLPNTEFCVHESNASITFYGNVSLVAYRGFQHHITSPIGYLLKLQNVFPLRVNRSVKNVIIKNDFTSLVEPFRSCYTSVSLYYNLNKVKPWQLSESMFCVDIFFGRHYLQAKLDTGVSVLHPNSLLISPSRTFKHAITYLSSFIDSSDYLNCASGDIFVSLLHKKNRYLVNTVEEFTYRIMDLIDTSMCLLLLFLFVVSCYVEFRIYKYFLTLTCTYSAFGKRHRVNDLHVYDIFFLFCENSNCDQAFVHDKLLPNLKNKHLYSVRSCGDIRPGNNLLEMYSEEILKCKKVVILWSKDYAEENECKYLFETAILGLHCDEVLKWEDIIILRYLSYPLIPLAYKLFLGGRSIEVPGDSDSSIEAASDFIKASFAKSESVTDKIRNNFIIRIVICLLRFGCSVYRQLVRAIDLLCG